MKSHSGEQVNLLGSCFPVKGMSYERMLYAVQCLKSNEDMILALAGQFKQVLCLWGRECTQPSFIQANLTESLYNIVRATHVFAMSAKKNTRRTKPPIKLTANEINDILKSSATPQQISKAEMSHIKFIRKDLFLTNGKAELPTVKQDRMTEDL